MAIPRPKILTRFTVPSGGWDIRIEISTAVAYDTDINATIPAGDYYVAGDHQSDDFLHVLCGVVNVVIQALFAITDEGMSAYIDDDGKVVLVFASAYFTGATPRSVKLTWTHADGPDIAKVLGFDHTADDSDTTTNYPTFTADYQHAYGWYADEDGQLSSLLVEDTNTTLMLQSVAHSGKVVTQEVAERYTNLLGLQWLARAKTYTRGIGYTETPVYGYDRNEGLEAWWRLAKRGRPFRVYKDGNKNRAYADGFAISAGTPTTATISGGTMSTNQWVGAIVEGYPWLATRSFPQRFYISSHTSTVITAANHDQIGAAGTEFDAVGTRVYLYHHEYQTYVIDAEAMKQFAPVEIPKNDHYNIDIPLLRYVTT